MRDGPKQIFIKANEEFSEACIIPANTGYGLAYFTTQSTVLENTVVELYTRSRYNTDLWIPFYNIQTKENANLPLITNKIIPCAAYIDGRGAGVYKFKLSQVQSNDIMLEIALTTII